MLGSQVWIPLRAWKYIHTRQDSTHKDLTHNTHTLKLLPHHSSQRQQVKKDHSWKPLTWVRGSRPSEQDPMMGAKGEDTNTWTGQMDTIKKLFSDEKTRTQKLGESHSRVLQIKRQKDTFWPLFFIQIIWLDNKITGFVPVSTHVRAKKF